MKKIAARLSIALLVLFGATGATADDMTDPYEILNEHYEAMGGLDRLRAQESSHVEGDLVLVGSGLKGSFVQWSEGSIRGRQEVDLKVIKQISGDNGEFAWMVDQNGKLQIRRDEETQQQRELQIRLAEFEHLDPESDVFSLRYEGVDTAAGSSCYVVRIANNINEDVTYQLYDTSSFLLLKTRSVMAEGETHSWFADYRDVDGTMFAYRQETVYYPSNMTQIISFTTVENNIPIDAALFEPPGDDVQDFRFTDGASVTMLFQFIENHIYLPVEVGGRMRLWILDTGASISVIDTAFAAELGLALEGQIKGQGAGNLVDVSFCTLPAFSLPGLEFDEQTAAAIGIGWLFDRWLGMEVVGILGYDFLSRLVTRVDYANETLTFYHPDSFSYVGDGTVLEAPISQRNMFELPVMVDGQYGGLWSLDLGAGGMSYHYQFADQHGLLDEPGVDGLGHGAGGAQPIRWLLSKSMEFGGYTVSGLKVSVPLERGEGAFGNTDLTGNIGNTLLRHFVLYLDYKREQVIVEQGDYFGRAFPRDNSGMQLAKLPNDSITVIAVADDTPAAEAGIEVDDLIVAVNDIEVEHLDGIVAVTRLLRKTPGTKLVFDILRDGETKKLTLTLQDLFH